MAASTIILPLILTATGIAQAADAYNHITYGRSGSGPVAFRGNINIIDWDGAGRSEIVSGIGRMYENTGPASQPMWSPHGKNHHLIDREFAQVKRFLYSTAIKNPHTGGIEFLAFEGQKRSSAFMDPQPVPPHLWRNTNLVTDHDGGRWNSTATAPRRELSIGTVTA